MEDMRLIEESTEKKKVASGCNKPEIKFLPVKYDDYGGVMVELNHPFDPEAFHEILRDSITEWKEEGVRGVWIKLPTRLINLAEIAIKEGFWVHHGEPTYLMLTYWIPGGVSDLPPMACHRVRIGALVLNHKEILVVQEKRGRLKRKGIWKIPTGIVPEGEDIKAAAVREVKEETGIDAEFIEVLAFRESHKTNFFGKSELLFFCMLQPINFDLQQQESEIAQLRWMPLVEYSAQQFNQKDEVKKYLIDVCNAKMDGCYTGFHPLPTTIPFYEDGDLYFNQRDLNSR